MKVKCDTCGKEFNRRPSRLKAKNYCSPACCDTRTTKPCGICGKPVTRCQSQMFENAFCSRACSSKWTSERMTEMNIDMNPERMVPETREKLRRHRLGKGQGKTYEKTFGVHTHRIIAEQKLGRKLLPGEVVHHIDGNVRNNKPENLFVFASQADHLAHHKNLDRIEKDFSNEI